MTKTFTYHKDDSSIRFCQEAVKNDEPGGHRRLTSFNNMTIGSYDAIGNPQIYKNNPMTWDFRNLRSYKGQTFQYTSGGLRTRKTQGNAVTQYYWAGDQLIAERRTTSTNPFFADITQIPHGPLNEYSNNNPFIVGASSIPHGPLSETPVQYIEYIYGSTGVLGFKLNQVMYWYKKNIQGDVTHVYDNNKVLKAQYQYDAWGVCTVLVDVDSIGTLNPIRYRSYYWDNEINLYYLQSRYYDPEVGRFISPDNIAVLDLTKNMVNGLNLYYYAANNPVNMVDSDGMYPASLWDMGPNNNMQSAQRVIKYFLYAPFRTAVERIGFWTGIADNFFGAINAFDNAWYSKTATILTWVAAGINAFTRIYDNFTNPNLNTQEKLVNSILDTLYVGGSVYAAVLITGAIFGPAGFAVAFISTMVLDYLWDDLGVGNAVKGVVNDFIDFIRKPVIFGIRLW